MLQRLEALDAPRPIVSFLDVHLETLVVVLLGQFKQEAEMRAWHVLFFVQLSKLCRTTPALVLPWLGEREDFLLRAFVLPRSIYSVSYTHLTLPTMIRV